MIEQLIQGREKQGTAVQSISYLFDVLMHGAFTCDLTAKWREAHMKELLAEMEQQAKALESKKHMNYTKGKSK